MFTNTGNNWYILARISSVSIQRKVKTESFFSTLVAWENIGIERAMAPESSETKNNEIRIVES